ncbi:hypothetical protein BVI2075_320277 [Burkholderia vietnamiensis]|nr:hypothetical protein BVI2075_320277 [Burkholderia vietnamiensis]
MARGRAGRRGGRGRRAHPRRRIADVRRRRAFRRRRHAVAAGTHRKRCAGRIRTGRKRSVSPGSALRRGACGAADRFERCAAPARDTSRVAFRAGRPARGRRFEKLDLNPHRTTHADARRHAPQRANPQRARQRLNRAEREATTIEATETRNLTWLATKSYASTANPPADGVRSRQPAKRSRCRASPCRARRRCCR